MDLSKLNEFFFLERFNCPWVSTRSMKDIIKELRDELDELETEVLKNPKNSNDLAEEMADVLSDILLLIHIAERDKYIENMNEIVSRALNKKIRRKGWILEGKKLSLEESSKIWHQAKLDEKRLNH